jgi:uncharacterized protein YndB with AHSA1/START domain
MGFTNPVCEVDARPGGAIHIVMRAPDGAEYPMRGEFREIILNERLAFTNQAVDRDGRAIIDGFTTVTFTEADGKTRMTLVTRATALVPEAVVMINGMSEGWTQSIDRLESHVTTVQSAEAPDPERELVITRVFDAPRSLVFKSWTDPAHSRRWAGPRGFTATHVAGDLRPGGAWRTCLRRDATGEELWQGGVYREIIEPERLVFTFAWDRDDGSRGHETLVTITFGEHRGKTTMIFRQGPFESVSQRDGHRGGWNSAFDRLAEKVAAGGPG